MKAQRYHSLGLAVLGSLLVLLSGSNVAAMSSSSSPLLDCTEASSADGDCDMDNNTEECGYDGGDCCECTCVSTTQYVCGVRAGFSCLDPSASCFVDAATASPASDSFLDGTLTPTPAAILTEAPTITASTEAPLIATSTEAPSITTPAEETATTFPTAGNSTASSCIPASLADGSCDSENNNEECGYDGGDCCECTCVSTSDFTCGENGGYDCVDPEASCEELSVEGRNSAYRATSSPVYCQSLAMCFFVLSLLRRLSQQ